MLLKSLKGNKRQHSSTSASAKKLLFTKSVWQRWAKNSVCQGVLALGNNVWHPTAQRKGNKIEYSWEFTHCKKLLYTKSVWQARSKNSVCQGGLSLKGPLQDPVTPAPPLDRGNPVTLLHHYPKAIIPVCKEIEDTDVKCMAGLASHFSTWHLALPTHTWRGVKQVCSWAQVWARGTEVRCEFT